MRSMFGCWTPCSLCSRDGHLLLNVCEGLREASLSCVSDRGEVDEESTQLYNVPIFQGSKLVLSATIQIHLDHYAGACLFAVLRYIYIENSYSLFTIWEL